MVACTNPTVTIKGLNIADLHNSNFVNIVQEIHDSASTLKKIGL